MKLKQASSHNQRKSRKLDYTPKWFNLRVYLKSADSQKFEKYKDQKNAAKSF